MASTRNDYACANAKTPTHAVRRSSFGWGRKRRLETGENGALVGVGGGSLKGSEGGMREGWEGQINK